MKTKFDFFGRAALVLTFAVAAATACRKDEVPVYPGTDITPSDYEIVDTPAEPGANPVGLYVLNEGNYGSNKAQLDFSISALRLISGIYILTTIRMS